jgi:hypothetical protein
MKEAVVLLIAVAMTLSTVALADTQKNETTMDLNTTNQGSGVGAIGNVVWDNGMQYEGLAAAQYDAVNQFDSFQADDFHFEEPTEVCDVHWIGGYWQEGAPGAFDWCISFYFDDGSGTAPAGTPYAPTYAGPFCYTDSQVTKVLLEEWYYEMSVDLPENIPFYPCEKYWISIWGVGQVFPQSGWGYHSDQILLHPAVWGSAYFGFPFWTDGYDVLGFDHDMCFQLTTKGDPEPPTPPVIDGPPCGHVGVEYTYTFHSDDPNGDMVTYHIDWGDGSTDTIGPVPPCTPVPVTHTYTSQGTYTISAYAEDTGGLTSPVSTYQVKMPRDKAISNFPILYHLIQILLQRLGL